MFRHIGRFVGGVFGSNGLTPAQMDNVNSIPNKQDKVIPSTVGNIQTLDGSGNTLDSGKIFNDIGTTTNDILSASKIIERIDNASAGKRFIANWNANTNTPTLPNLPTAPTYKQGDYYDVIAEGTQFGIDFTVGDRIVVAYDINTSALIWIISDFGKIASQINYSNVTSGLVATNVQTAVDELATEKLDKLIVADIFDTQANILAITSLSNVGKFAFTTDTKIFYKGINNGGSLLWIQGFLPPRMTTAQRNNILTPAEGLIVFDTDIKSLFVYQNTSWQRLTSTANTLPYIQTFNATTDWGTASGGFYTITIPLVTHGKAPSPTNIQVFELIGSDYQQIFPVIKINASGDVLIQIPEIPESRFEGKISINF